MECGEMILGQCVVYVMWYAGIPVLQIITIPVRKQASFL